VNRYALSFPDAQLPDPFGVVAISNDGSRIFYLGRSPRSPGVTQFWYKSRDSLESVVLAGAEGASSIAVAPDGQTVAVIERNIVRKLSITGAHQPWWRRTPPACRNRSPGSTTTPWCMSPPTRGD
jgi:hypothetical protein